MDERLLVNASYGLPGAGKLGVQKEQTIRQAIDERIRLFTQEIKRNEELKRGMSEDLLGMPISYLRGLY